MENEGLEQSTINNADKQLRLINVYADLNNPEEVKRHIAKKKVSDSYKYLICINYDRYCKHYGLVWEKPKYEQQSKPIRIPTKTQIEMLIANASPTLSVKLTLSKETGLRPIEVHDLKVRDIDFEQRLVYPTTAKHGAPRQLRISTSLKVALQTYIHKKELAPTDKLFKGDSKYYGKYYRNMRNKLADKLGKPELRTIRLYDFRHYFATMLYARTKDILLVKQQLGHKKIKNTMIYTQLINVEDDEWTCRAALNVKQSTELIEAGFEYVTGEYSDGGKLFRKRKILC